MDHETPGSSSNNWHCEPETAEEAGEAEETEELREEEEREQISNELSEEDISNISEDTNKSTSVDSFINGSKKHNELRFSLSNARSLAKKMTSLIDMFREKKLHFALVTETWLQSTRETENELLDIKHAEKIEFICRNRGRRGCLLYTSDAADE